MTVTTPFDLVSDPGDPLSLPLGSRVKVTTNWCDFHPFRVGQTGTVVRHNGHRHLGVIVRLDEPYECQHGNAKPHIVSEFNFDAADLDALLDQRSPR